MRAIEEATREHLERGRLHVQPTRRQASGGGREQDSVRLLTNVCGDGTPRAALPCRPADPRGAGVRRGHPPAKAARSTSASRRCTRSSRTRSRARPCSRRRSRSSTARSTRSRTTSGARRLSSTRSRRSSRRRSAGSTASTAARSKQQTRRLVQLRRDYGDSARARCSAGRSTRTRRRALNAFDVVLAGDEHERDAQRRRVLRADRQAGQAHLARALHARNAMFAARQRTRKLQARDRRGDRRRFASRTDQQHAVTAAADLVAAAARDGRSTRSATRCRRSGSNEKRVRRRGERAAGRERRARGEDPGGRERRRAPASSGVERQRRRPPRGSSGR